MLVLVKTLIMLMLFLEQARATYMILAGDLVPAGTTLVTPAVRFLVWENTTRKELQPLELTIKLTTDFAYNGISRGCIKNVIG